MRKKAVWGWSVLALVVSTVLVYAAASYPSAVKSFTTKTDGPGQTIFAAHINDLQDEVVAIESALLNGFAHLLKPLSDATYDLGTSSLKWRDLYLSRNATVGGTLAVTGTTTLAGQIGGWTVITTTSTGAQNDFAPGLIGNTILRANNASLLTISGFTGGTAGQHLIVQSIGAGRVDFTHQTLSTATNQQINFATSAPTSLAAGVGALEYVYDATTTRWRLIAHEQGAWITPTFVAGDFTGSASLTWTQASAATMAYYLRGRTLTVTWQLSGGSLGGTPSTTAKIGNGEWGGFTIAKSFIAPSTVFEQATAIAGRIDLTASGTFIGLLKIDASNYTAAPTNTNFYGQVTFEVT